MKKIFKSAVAFFFLFFLHGTSIGNGQQGISYNVSVLYDVADFQHESPIRSTKVEFITNV
jgi:hypothetical protein